MTDKKAFIEIPAIEQGSSAWHEWRRSVIGSSDAPAIMKENPWKSHKALIDEKTGVSKPFSGNAATRRGQILEPEARQKYEDINQISINPAVLQSIKRPWQAASVDGINYSNGAIVEIKCGQKSYEYTAGTGKVPAYYFAQLQHILSVTEMEWIDYFSYLPSQAPLRLRVVRDESYIARLLAAEEHFVNELRNRGCVLRESVWGSIGEGNLNNPPRLQSETKSLTTHGVKTWPDGRRYEGDFVDDKRTGRGILTWPSGDRYEGDWVENNWHGRGIFTGANGGRYEGDWVDNKKTGRGIDIWADGQRYEGDWVENKRTGRGIDMWPDGRRYEGDFVDGKRTGRGIYTWPDGQRYEGDWVDGKRTGRGIYTWPDGQRYEGDFVDGKRIGRGIHTWPDGRRYEGDFVEDKWHGHGIYTWANGKYEGDWVEDHWHGRGIFTYSDGQRFEATFVSGKLNGRGIHTWPDGPRYEGDWVENKRTGRGVTTFPDGVRYEGDFVEDKWHGHGIYTRPDGQRYEGDWVDNKKTGLGIYTWPDGRRYEGGFIDDKRTGQGSHTWPDGGYEEGDFVDGKLHGTGSKTTAHGVKYMGDFVGGKLNGSGSKNFPDGTRYVGTFVDGNLHGRGFCQWPNGDEFSGNFSEGIPDGNGRLELNAEEFFEGSWYGVQPLGVNNPSGHIESAEFNFSFCFGLIAKLEKFIFVQWALKREFPTPSNLWGPVPIAEHKQRLLLADNEIKELKIFLKVAEEKLKVIEENKGSEDLKITESPGFFQDSIASYNDLRLRDGRSLIFQGLLRKFLGEGQKFQLHFSRRLSAEVQGFTAATGCSPFDGYLDDGAALRK